ncbi:MAG: MBL fold metallo-hydrolase [Synergistaceae bacterium]|nr:MBL fold metallo-hydrolase [Synergistaceae bacterium]
MVAKVYDNPEIYRIEVPLPQNPLKYLNCHVVKSGGEVLIVDTGFNRPECRAAFEAGLEELKISLDGAVLFLTHIHSDHIGLAEQCVKAGSKVRMSKIDHDLFRYILSGAHWVKMEKFYLSEGFPESEMALQSDGNQARIYAPRTVFPVTPVEDGTELRLGNCLFRCVHTPGHSPGHTCLWLEREKLLFAGDHVLCDITPNIGVRKDGDTALANYLTSLDKVRRLAAEHVFPAHRHANRGLSERIDELKVHHEQRLNEILAVMSKEPGLTAYEIAAHLSWSVRGLLWKKFSPTQKRFAMSETLSHLMHLRNGARAVRYLDGAVYRNRAANG